MQRAVKSVDLLAFMQRRVLKTIYERKVEARGCSLRHGMEADPIIPGTTGHYFYVDRSRYNGATLRRLRKEGRR